MPGPTSLSVAQLARLIGTHECPTIVDVRDGGAQNQIPGARRHAAAVPETWASALPSRATIVVCDDGRISAGVAAWLRHAGLNAETLEGGMAAWHAAAAPVLTTAPLPPRDAHGRTIWVTRARPKVDRVACPWLIRRFVDPTAVFLFVAAHDVSATATRFGAAAFDIEDVFWSHRGALCTFDAMIQEFGLASVPGLSRLAVIVRGADTARPDLAPQCAGLLAASLGLSRMYRDDLAQLEAGFALYDAFWRWCRDAVTESHSWPSPAATRQEQPA